MNILILSVLAVILFFVVKIYLQHKPETLEVGDVVIYFGQSGFPEQRNMITIVLATYSSKTVVLRGIGTTVQVCRKAVRKIPVDRNYPLRVPTKPVWKEHQHGNQAPFEDIDLRWLSYNHKGPGDIFLKDKESETAAA